jgi:hypothetical protein
MFQSAWLYVNSSVVFMSETFNQATERNIYKMEVLQAFIEIQIRRDAFDSFRIKCDFFE